MHKLTVMFTVLLLIVSLINITLTTPIRIKEYKVNGAEGASLGKFISDYINKKLPQTWMDDDTDFDIFNIVGKYENFEDLDGSKYESSAPTDSDSQEGGYVAIGHEVARPTWRHGERKPVDTSTGSVWTDMLEPLINYSKILKNIKYNNNNKDNAFEDLEVIEFTDAPPAIPNISQPNRRSKEDQDEIAFSDIYQPQDNRKKRFITQQHFNESLNAGATNMMQYGMSQVQMPMTNQYHMSMQMAVPMPMSVPMPVPMQMPMPVMVPGRTYFEPVIHDHPHPSKMQQKIERDKRKYQLSSESRENFQDYDDY